MEANGNSDAGAERSASDAGGGEQSSGCALFICYFHNNRHSLLCFIHFSPDLMIRLVLDFLISQGHREAAEVLCEDANIPFPRDALENLDHRMCIRDDILEGKAYLSSGSKSIQEAIEKITVVVPDLLSRNTVLHLRLLQQHLIELIRNKMVKLIFANEMLLQSAASEKQNSQVKQCFVEEAVTFTQSIVEKVEDSPEMEKEMQMAFSMIAFERPEDSPVPGFLDVITLARRTRTFNNTHLQLQVANDVNRAILEALNKPSAPKLETLFQMILWSKNKLNHKDTPEQLNRLFTGQVDPFSVDIPKNSKI
ncbi:unnamed protein product [Gongylonema pulchrum]|uniref:LisH domain-containing protein n=1 Tax=Gongylonema pulchrum TaxID=637853 RepID=A0A183DUZ7_9BILA|nr:unnamed protein product [Gongylonema pulchrum]